MCNHFRETATHSAKIHSLARKYEHLRISRSQLRFLRWHPVIRKDHRLIGSIFSSRVPEGHRKTDAVFFTPAAAKKNI